MDTKILNLYDCILRQCDLDCLQPQRWLNDNIIEFYLQYLSSYIPPDRKDILYIPPSTTFLMLQGGLEVAKSVSESLDLQEYSTVFFALNDNANPESLYGGTHWSSLVVDVQSSHCIHYDSSIGSNTHVAQRFARVLSGIFAKDVTLDHARDCPQQDNGYDCGLFCIYTASSIFPYHQAVSRKDTERVFLPHHVPLVATTMESQYQTVATMRQDLIQLIQNLAESES